MQLLLPQYIVPVVPQGLVLELHAVAIDQGIIVKIGPREQLLQLMPEAERVELNTHALIPGLINMHTHSPMTLLRGYADDLGLETWLNDHIWPAEHKWADGDFVEEGTELAVLEMIRGGTTCFNENYFHPDRIAEVVSRSGVRACIGIPIIDFKTSWASSLDEYLEKGRAVAARFEDEKKISFSLAPHSMYSVSSEMLTQIAKVSAEKNMPVHMHLLEIEWEKTNSFDQFGKGPLQHVEDLGLLNKRLIAVHMAHLDDNEIEMLAKNHVQLVHCPQSNLKLGSGLCRVQDLIEAGVNVCIGTDGAASNNDLDMFGEMQTAALLAKGVAGDPRAVNAETALEMATINGAKALGMDQNLGSIEDGKFADLCAVDLSHPRTQPLHHVISQLVYAVASNQVSDVWISGCRVMKNQQLTTIDETEILHKARLWAKRMSPAERVVSRASR
jgi:5-methylthioadenosine/S-adenosylhomocysteine deaminase